MTVRMVWRAIWGFLRQYGLTALLFLAMAAVTLRAIAGVSRDAAAQQLRQAELAVRRAAVSCYAVEGAYPESFDYLKEHYDVYIDEMKFAVLYEVYGSNLMPDVTVVEVAP